MCQGCTGYGTPDSEVGLCLCGMCQRGAVHWVHKPTTHCAGTGHSTAMLSTRLNQYLVHSHLCLRHVHGSPDPQPLPSPRNRAGGNQRSWDRRDQAETFSPKSQLVDSQDCSPKARSLPGTVRQRSCTGDKLEELMIIYFWVWVALSVWSWNALFCDVWQTWTRLHKMGKQQRRTLFVSGSLALWEVFLSMTLSSHVDLTASAVRRILH